MAGPAGGRDATGRRTAFLPAAVLGNGSLLATLSARGELERLFWPHVDHGQHLGELRLGLQAHGGDVLLLDEEPLTWEQAYLPRASVLRTVARGDDAEAELVDLVTPGEPVLVRRVRFRCSGRRLALVCRPALEESVSHTAAYADPDVGALVFYRRRVALAVALRGAGGELPVSAELASAFGDTDPSRGTMAHRGTIEGVVELADEGEAVVAVAFGETPGEALARLQRPLQVGFELLLEERLEHDRAGLELAAPCALEVDGAEELYQRSLLVLELLADRETGAVIAAPELDPHFEHCGGYGFVWPRDLAFIVLGLLAAGRGDLAVPALRWLARHQTPEGLWLQRHWTDGSLAPSWGLHQIDETGAVLVAYEAAWRTLADQALDRELWPSARSAAELLAGFVDDATGLPLPSIDLWEQHDGQHAYSAAATAAGLAAAADAALRHEPELAGRYRAVAAGVRAAIETHLWSEEHGRYLRSRWIGRDDHRGGPVPPLFERRLPYPNRRVLSVDPFDARVDSSLLGLAWPFGVVEPRSPHMQATVEAIERELLLEDGGVLRHEGDDYAGGNPWLISTLWLGLAYRQADDEERFLRCVRYVLERQTPLGLLAEQVTRDGRQAWVVPLAWSHALFLLAVRPEAPVVANA